MNNKTINRYARALLVKCCKLTVSSFDIKKVIKNQGFVIAEYSSFDNDNSDSRALLKNLNLLEYAANVKGFTYANADLRIVFINEDLSEEEKIVVLLHEEAHILFKHYSHLPVFGESIKEELEANLFVNAVLQPSFIEKLKVVAILNKKYLQVAMGITLLISIIAVSYEYNVRESSYHGKYYVTRSGKKYHKENCLAVKNRTNTRRITVEEVKEGRYTPCKICLPCK